MVTEFRKICSIPVARYLLARSFYLCLITFISSANLGCLTQQLWRNANETTLTFDKLAAVTNSGRGSSSLLFSYRRDDGSVAFLSVPLGSDLRPIDPFLLKDKNRIGSDVSVLVSPAQVEQVLHDSGPLCRLELTAEETASVHDTRPEMYDSYGRDCGPLIAIAYRMAPDGKCERPNFAGSSLKDARTPPGDSTIVLVPKRAPRPADDVEGARAEAVLLTPFSLAIDAVAITVAEPFFFVLFLTHGPAI